MVCEPIDSDHAPPLDPLDDQALHDEPVGRLDQQHVLHAALVDERAHRAEDFLEVLARASLVDPHPLALLIRIRRPVRPVPRVYQRANRVARRTAELPGHAGVVDDQRRVGLSRSARR